MEVNKYFFDFKLDKKGPHGISKDSYFEKDKLALIVIDMQNYMTRNRYSGKWSSRGAEDYYYIRCENLIIPNLIKIINFFRKNNIKIVYTRIASQDKYFSDTPSTSKKNLVDDDNIDREGKRWTLFQDDDASHIDSRIKPEGNDIVIMKTGSGAFCSSEIDLILRSNNISKLIFSGGLTDACVSSTLRQAWDRGYLCTILEDACLSSSMEDHDAEISILKKYYAWSLKTSEIIDLMRDKYPDMEE
ncbi:MAG: cysteine hydrolase [Actinomycetota bacterium]|nr:cysteine hydrolase [Actinomycetota bacterium]